MKLSSYEPVPTSISLCTSSHKYFSMHQFSPQVFLNSAFFFFLARKKFVKFSARCYLKHGVEAILSLIPNSNKKWTAD